LGLRGPPQMTQIGSGESTTPERSGWEPAPGLVLAGDMVRPYPGLRKPGLSQSHEPVIALPVRPEHHPSRSIHDAPPRDVGTEGRIEEPLSEPTARGLSNRNWLRGATPAQRLPYTAGMRGRALPIAALMALSARPGAPPPPAAADGPLIQRAKSLELNTPYVPPPGDPLEHHAAGYAKVMCSAVFITGLDPDFAAANVGFFTGPYEERGRL